MTQEIDYNMPGEHSTDQLFVPDVPPQMRQMASEEDVTSFVQTHKYDLLLFGCDRSLPICRYDGLPEFWLPETNSHFNCFTGTAQPGEFYVFQIGAYNSSNRTTDPLELNWKDIVFDDYRCFNLGGIDQNGTPFTKEVRIPPKTLHPLWLGVQIPLEAEGMHSFTLQLTHGDEQVNFNVSLHIKGDVLHDHGDSDEWRLARLRWLDSTIGLDTQFVPAPYKPVKLDDNTIDIIGRKIQLSTQGLPSQIETCFNSNNTSFTNTFCSLLSSPFSFSIKIAGQSIPFAFDNFKLIDQSSTNISLRSIAEAQGITVSIYGQANYAGFISYQIHVEAKNDIELDDVNLNFEMHKDFSSHFIGLGQEGGKCPDSINWTWDHNVLQDGFWLGASSGGLRIRFKGANFHTPLNNAYYHFGQLVEPKSWANNGKGGIRLNKKQNGNTSITAYSGLHTLKADSKLEFNFDLDVTPLKPINPKRQWDRRFYHPVVHDFKVDENPLGLSPADAKAAGASHFNVHHATGPNPIINYPYSDISLSKLKNFVEDCHQNNLKVGLYYTTREVSVNIPEFWALLSLSGEIICPGPGAEARPVTNPEGPHPWLKENVHAPFIPAWREIVRGDWGGKLDLSVITSPDSRWNNFYMEGMAYLLKQTPVDGFYFDDTMLSRNSFHRIRKITSDAGVEGNLDFHSWNPYKELGGFASVICRDFEYFHNLDNLWLGESFHYDKMSPDNWLVEVSGLPFGLMSEMLQGGGNPWRGLLFGMTCRFGWRGDPHNIWQLWDNFGVTDSNLIGWWQPDCPVTCSDEQVKASVYLRNDSALICLASWADDIISTTLEINWQALPFDEANASFLHPQINDLQEAASCSLNNSFKLEPLSGTVILATKKS